MTRLQFLTTLLLAIPGVGWLRRKANLYYGISLGSSEVPSFRPLNRKDLPTYWFIQREGNEYLVFKNGELLKRSDEAINLRDLSCLSNNHVTFEFGEGLFNVKNVIPPNCSIIGSGSETTILKSIT